MENKDIYIGIDIGTTSVKSIISNSAGDILFNTQIEYPIYQTEHSFAEQDPDEISAAVWQVVKKMLNSKAAQHKTLAGIGFSSAMHSVILVDESNQPLTRCIIWADNRSSSEADEIKENLGLTIYHRTGTPIHPMSPLTKIRWMSKNEPKLLNQAYKVISIKEYVLYQLCGVYAVDYSIASATGMFSLQENDWDDEAIEIAGLRREQLSEPVPTTKIFNIKNTYLANNLGIPIHTPIVVGASDGALANLGAGAINHNTAVITIGTSGAVRTISNFTYTDEKMKSFCYVLADNHWVTGGPFNNGGISLQWLRDLMMNDGMDKKEFSYNTMTEKASTISAGSEGLLFLPYLTGERAPHWNSFAKGVFFGAGLYHRQEHFIKAVLEGVIFCAYSVFCSLQHNNSSIDKLYATGGFTHSSLWLQITADIFGLPVYVPESPESACLGAVMLTMLATGAIESLDDTDKMIHIKKVYYPNTANNSNYKKYYELFEQLYDSLEVHFKTHDRISKSV